MTAPPAGEVLQLRVTLRDVEPPVHRVIQIPASSTFHGLHRALQCAFGWKNYHLYEFLVGRQRVAAPDPDRSERPAPLDPRKTRLAELLLPDTRRFAYVYDFGDDWIHDIEVEKRLPKDPTARYPVCLGGARACPPEDSGGPHGYDHFLEAWGDPQHEDHEDMRRWADSRFDPERFDLKAVNKVLERLHGPAGKGT
ncbi:MAG TPA: plasmid pRiA4b ORF-3 family protein [Thermoanaerobaculia bacterium]